MDRNERNERSSRESGESTNQRTSRRQDGEARVVLLTPSAYWPFENERGWYGARMFELYEDTACVEYADYPGKKHEPPSFLDNGIEVKEARFVKVLNSMTQKC